jgi:hypothetical protein
LFHFCGNFVCKDRFFAAIIQIFEPFSAKFRSKMNCFYRKLLKN